MLLDLFTNINIVVSFLLLIGQIFQHYSIGNGASLRLKTTIGGIFGIMGIILMIYSISVTDIIIFDLRMLAIILAGIFGGFTSALFSSLIIGIFRIVFFGVNTASLIAMMVVIVVGICSAFISRSNKIRAKKFIYMFLLSMFVSTIALIYLLSDSAKLMETLFYYWLIYIFGAILAYYALEYIILNNKTYREMSYYQIMADNLLDMISIHKPDGTYLYVSPSSKQLLGYRSKEIIGQKPYDFIHQDDIRDIRRVHKDILSTMNDYSHEYRMKRKDGRYVWVETTFKSIRNSDRNIKELVCASRDITERKEAEWELKKKKKQAIEANRMKNQFLANMSHELRTPLNSIIGFTTRVLEKSKDHLAEQQQENLMIVKEEARHLLTLITDLLDYSKIEAGKMGIFIESFNIEDIVDEVYSVTLGLLEEKGLEFQKICPKDMEMYIKSDRLKLKRILINLLTNAFKYSEKGVVKLIINKSEDYFKIEVVDQGIGIAEEDLLNIFDEFRQLDGSYTRKVGGTGLGLAITKKLIDKLGGSIQVESTINVGSSFIVYLPVDYNNRKT